MTRGRRHLVVFARRPVLGRVKRRLAADIGAVEAARVYRVLLGRTLRRLSRDRRWRTWLAVTPFRGGPPVTHGIQVVDQGAGDLGDRMGRALSGQGPAPVVIVGSDIPGVTAAEVWRAFRALGRAGWVFGPAEDGGFWLIGSAGRGGRRRPLCGVRWGSRHALSDVLANLEGRRIARVATLRDLDRVEDLRQLRKQQKGLDGFL